MSLEVSPVVQKELTPHERARLSGAIREKSAAIDIPQTCVRILTTNLHPLIDATPATFAVADRARHLLINLSRKATVPGATVSLSRETDRSLAFTLDVNDFSYMLDYLQDQGWCERLAPPSSSNIVDETWGIKITPAGWEEVRRRPLASSVTGFVAMWFGEDVRQAYDDALAPAIRAAGYEPRRVDTIEFNEGIVDRILAEIREARFLVADLTGHRQGVYLEAGFAWGLGIPVIWTCHEDHAATTHFDAQHLNQIRWKENADLAEKLENRLRATIGKGPLRNLNARM